jgi:predicted HicB family RNase H-like nuclease
MTIDAHAYNITVRRGEFEGEVLFEARVKELPDLAEYADTYDEAYALAVDAIETTAEVLAQNGRSMPVASVPADDFSGRVTLRLAKSLHRSLRETAEAEGVSLNQHLVNILTYYSGFAVGQRHEGTSPWKLVGKVASRRGERQPQLRLVHSSSYTS